MTDKDKLAKVRAEIERLMKDVVKHSDIGDIEHDSYYDGRRSVLCLIRDFIDSMQEEPKKCMYSKGNYTAEDRKALCDGCEEKCKHDKSDDFTKALAECIHNAQCNVIDPMVFAETWKDELIKLSKCEEPVSEDLEGEIDNAHKLFYEEVGWDSDEGAKAYVADWFAHYFANWQKQQILDSNTTLQRTFALGKQEMKQQMMAKAVDVTIAIPYQNGYGGYTQLVDSKEGLPFGENLKVLVIKQE